MHILFIGAGRMAEAIASGLLAREGKKVKITLSNEKNDAKLEALKNTYNVEITHDWRTVIEEVDTVILACPPSTHEDVLREMTRFVKTQFIVTVAAGVDPDFLEAHLPQGSAVAWLMPNTAASVGKSMSLYTYGQHVTDEHKMKMNTILRSIGESENLSAAQIHELTAITGSAPAYLYAFVEALSQSATEYGLSADQARRLVNEMVIGSAKMLQTYQDPALLREQVTSPGGATDAGLKSLERNNFHQAIKEAVKATNDHAKAKKN
ncbi:pyrroline-5-carboxylate reductase [Bacillus sp. FJAT-45037]|uniref:pyrroline-5-carboxylate reductase n=1 Tax=Bacillus sp. FJAT-45037 TaxID=2011007 RepID=UPI000C236E91|nr:pyrroline-5-carboxylate reductase [Bacillus sp. FJAT-45037]